jgi:hypothetical protein
MSKVFLTPCILGRMCQPPAVQTNLGVLAMQRLHGEEHRHHSRTWFSNHTCVQGSHSTATLFHRHQLAPCNQNGNGGNVRDAKISYLWFPSDGRDLPLRSSSLMTSWLFSELMSSKDREMEGSRFLKTWSPDGCRGREWLPPAPPYKLEPGLTVASRFPLKPVSLGLFVLPHCQPGSWPALRSSM